MLTADEVRALSRPSAWRSLIALVADWAGIVAIFSIVARWPSPWMYAASVVLMGRQQLALAIMMHDAAHRRLFENRKLNDYVAQFFAAAPVFFSLYTYRRTHLKHHRAPLAADDPDLRLIGGYPIPLRSFVRKLARDAFGISYFKFIFHFAKLSGKRRGPASSERSSGEWMMPRAVVFASMVLAQAAVFTALSLAGHAALFFWIWFLPFMTTLQLFLRIRGIAEHAGYHANEDQRFSSRTVVNPWQTFFVAPHRVNYHIEHHSYPSIPWFNLARAHVVLRQRGALPEKNVFRGYGAVVKELVLTSA